MKVTSRSAALMLAGALSVSGLAVPSQSVAVTQYNVSVTANLDVPDIAGNRIVAKVTTFTSSRRVRYVRVSARVVRATSSSAGGRGQIMASSGARTVYGANGYVTSTYYCTGGHDRPYYFWAVADVQVRYREGGKWTMKRFTVTGSRLTSEGCA